MTSCFQGVRKTGLVPTFNHSRLNVDHEDWELPRRSWDICAHPSNCGSVFLDTAHRWLAVVTLVALMAFWIHAQFRLKKNNNNKKDVIILLYSSLAGQLAHYFKNQFHFLPQIIIKLDWTSIPMQTLFFTILQLDKTGFLILQKTSGACLPPFVAAFQLIFWHTEQSQIPFVSAGSPRTPTISSMFSHLISLNLFIYPRALVVGSGLVPDVHTDSTPEAQTSPLRAPREGPVPFIPKPLDYSD